MKILYLQKKEPSKTLQKIIRTQSDGNEVKTIKLNEIEDFKKLVEDLFKFDKVICW